MTSVQSGPSVLGEVADELGATVRAFARAKAPETEVRRLMETTDGFDESLWRQMATELGLPGVTIPGEYGGAGSSVTALAAACQELGFYVVCTPLLSTVIAGEAILATEDADSCAEHLPGIASGDTRATVAVTEPDGKWAVESIQTTADRLTGSDARLQGEKAFVLDGMTANLLIVIARDADGLGVYAVDPTADGVSRAPMETLDATRKQARIEFSGVRGRLVGRAGDGERVMGRVLQYAAVAIAAEQVGGSQACLEMAVQYAKDRVQFGRQIGSFQAIKHKCAEMLRLTEFARAAAYEAAVATASHADDARLTASVAKVFCSEAYSWVAAENIQVHGGIGFTWEHPAHLYFRRAKSTELMFGTPREHRDLVLQYAGI